MKLMMTTFIAALALPMAAKADNPLTTEQLMKASDVAVQAEKALYPDMAMSISGFRVSTVGKNAQVIVEMNADGMHMSTKYLCIAQSADMICNRQQ